MDQSTKKYQKRGISLKLLSWIISAFVLIISTALITSLVLISNENNEVRKANENYITLKEASSDVQIASDYLTAQVRSFVANAEKKYMDAYFEEANVTQRREKALDKIHKLVTGTKQHDEIHVAIESAINESKDLMKLEYYAMKLVCVEQGISYAEYPEVDKANIEGVLPENMRLEAFNAVLGPEYIAKKETISSHVNNAFKVIDDLISKNSEESSNGLKTLIVFQTITVVIHIVFAVGVVITLILYVLKPMSIALHAIEENKEIHTNGTSEFNYLASAYNDIHLQNEKVKEKLTFEAEHDKLTNLYNRTGYASLYRRMMLDKALYILIDVDGFKEINDKYGHDIGDRVLIKLAKTLDTNFIEDNAFVFRIGGDEFAVLVENIDDAMDNSIVERMNKINAILSAHNEKMPSFSLSIGIAHGDEDDTTDSLFKKADNALYKVKQSGKSGVIYDKN